MQASEVLFHLERCPIGVPARRQACSRCRELEVIPSALRPAASIRPCMDRAAPVSTAAMAGSSATSASRPKIFACAAALRSHSDLAGRQEAWSTMSCKAFRLVAVIRRQAMRVAACT